MPEYHSRNPRERRLRALYRKRMWTCGIVMLIIGLVLGFFLCRMYLLDRPSFLNSATATPTPRPVLTVTEAPTAEPTEAPTAEPTEEPTAEPTEEPTAEPTEDAGTVSIQPAIVINALDDVKAVPTAEPTEEPTAEPTEEPTAEPTEEPTPEPTEEPTAEPTEEPTPEPTEEPTAEPTEEPTPEPTEEPTPEPTEEPTPEPTEEPTPEPTEEPTPEPSAAPVIVPFGESCTFDTQITESGAARMVADDAAYETLNLTLRVDAYKDHAYFEEQYSQAYALQGNEAAVEFDIALNDYSGSAEIIPQNFLQINFYSEDMSASAMPYQITDAEIGGKTNIAISSGETATLYKRLDYKAEQGDMFYMVVTTYSDGKEQTYWFEMQDPNAGAAAEAEENAGESSGSESTGTTESDVQLTIGSQGSEVKKLQAKLIELKLLQGQPDGKFGKYTAEAVKIMQKKFGMEQTGIADAAFLEKLYNN